MTTRSLTIFSVCLLAAGASAQSRSSFLDVDAFEDVIVMVSNGGLTYDVELGPNPTMEYQGDIFEITDLFGFWALSNDDDLEVVHQNIGVWDAHENQAGTGGIVGWKTNPNTGLTPGDSITFTYDELTTARVEQVGFHIRLDGTFPGASGNTGFATVPEPGSLIALAFAGGLLVIRRKRACTDCPNPSKRG